MSIGYILKGYPRLSETFISQEIQMLEERGFEIEIFSLRKAREAERHPVVEKIRARVTYIPEYFVDAPFSLSARNFATMASRPFAYFRWFAHAVRAAVRARGKSPLKRFFQAAWLVNKRGLGGGPVTHLHTHFVHSPTELGFYAAKLTGLTYSISAHAKDIYTSPMPAIRERIRHSEFLMTCTGYNVDFLRRQPGMPAEKIHRVYHGISTATFSPSPVPFSQASGMRTLVTCARLVEKKGYPFVFRALKLVRDAGVDLAYDIYGGGELKAALAALANELGIADRVRFHGNITQAKLIERYRDKGVFILGCVETAAGDRDGIPNALAEAMSMEMPVIATTVSGIPELVEDGRSGLLVPPADERALAHAILRIQTEPTYGDALGREARLRVQAVFEAHDCIRECERRLAPYRVRKAPARFSRVGVHP